jgi:glycosyltransferase involved in cell wall biosynthesis
MESRKNSLVESIINIISSHHHGFAGGSKNTSRLLSLLAENNYSVEAYYFELPQYFLYNNSKVKTHILESKQSFSEVVSLNNLQTYLLSNQIFQSIDSERRNILFATNLFPYCDILHDVKTQLNFFKNDIKLILHPVGSDIWQIGTQLKPRVKWLLDSPLVDSIITYSDIFIAEIKEYYNIKREIRVLQPILDSAVFFKISEEEKLSRRVNFGFTDEDFIVHHHSSMRNVKCPEVVIDIVMKAANRINRRVILIMAGPLPFKTIKTLNLGFEKISETNILKYKSVVGNLHIYWTETLTNVESLMQLADVELNSSLHDSFNLALMEAMACGIPVVTSDVVGIKNHILKSNSGYCFPTKKLGFDDLNIELENGGSKKGLFDIDYAVDCIQEIAMNRVLSLQMGSAGANYTVTEFSTQNCLNESVKYFN